MKDVDLHVTAKNNSRPVQVQGAHNGTCPTQYRVRSTDNSGHNHW